MAKKTAKRTAPQKTCPKCHKQCHARSKVCPNCEYQFPAPVAKSNGKPKTTRHKAAAGVAGTTDSVTAAAGFVRAAGGFANARDILNALESVRGL